MTREAVVQGLVVIGIILASVAAYVAVVVVGGAILRLCQQYVSRAFETPGGATMTTDPRPPTLTTKYGTMEIHPTRRGQIYLNASSNCMGDPTVG